MKNYLLFLLILTLSSSKIMASGMDFPLPPDSLLSQFEKESLAFMREEEKLAFDAYSLLQAKWNTRQFTHISESESRHMAAVKSLLDQFGLPDPAAGQPAGTFLNPVLQKLYQDLASEGMKSETDAFLTGAAIEEIDIRDLKQQLTWIRSDDIRFVYGNLMRGSRNHLRAFVKALAAKGIKYTPRYLETEDYENIINSPMEPGGGRGRF